MSDAPTKSPVGGSPRFTVRSADDPTYDVDPGRGWVLFAGIMLGVVGVLNLIYGIGAIGDANVFTNDVRLVVSDLSAYGWLLIILGVVQVTGGFSLMVGNAYGRFIGVVVAGLGAFWALISIAGAHPWWNLGVFSLCLYVLAGIVEYGEDERAGRTTV
jgi:hypothetical protein